MMIKWKKLIDKNIFSIHKRAIKEKFHFLLFPLQNMSTFSSVVIVIFWASLGFGQAALTNLTLQNPLYFICLEEISSAEPVTVCVDPKVGTLQLLLTHMYPNNEPLKAFKLYDSQDLSNFVLT